MESDRKREMLLKVLRLGEAIYKYSDSVSAGPFSPPFQNTPSKDSATLLDQIKENTNKLLVAIEASHPCLLGVVSAMKAASKLHPHYQSIQVISLACFFECARTSHGEETVESLVLRMQPLLDNDEIMGKITARELIAPFLEQRIFLLNGHELHLGTSLMNFCCGGNPLMSPNLDEAAVAKYRESKSTESKADSNDAVKPANDSSRKHERDFARYLKELPSITPMDLDCLLTERGYVGQRQGRKTICLGIHRHVRRLKNILVEKIPVESLPPRENMLVLGPTGCGKTYAMELILSALKIPLIIVDSTAFTEAGYVGEEVPTILTRLLSASGNLLQAQTGVIVLDEIDKIAGASERSNRNPDVSRTGVQRELLRMLDGCSMEIPTSMATARRERATISFSTHNVMFVGCGSFYGLAEIANPSPIIGFNTDPEKEQSTQFTASDFHRFGIMPELFGRFSSIVHLQELTAIELKQILQETAVKRFERELELEGVGLIIDDEVPDILIDRALQMKTGARGISSALNEILNSACYRAYSTSGRNRKIRLYVEDGEIKWAIHRTISRSSVATQDCSESSGKKIIT